MRFDKEELEILAEIAGITVTEAEIKRPETTKIALLKAIRDSGGIGTGGTGLTTTQSNALSTLITALENNKELSDENFTTEEKELLASVVKTGNGDKFLNDKGEYQQIGIVVVEEPLEWYKASNTEHPTYAFQNDVMQNGEQFYVSSHPYPHDNICVCDKLKGKNKVIYYESEDFATTCTDYLFMRSNGHAHDDGGAYKSLCIKTKASDGQTVTLLEAAGIDATETWKGQDVSSSTFANTLDRIAISAKFFNEAVNIEIYSLRQKNKFRKIFSKPSGFNSYTGIENGISVLGTDNTKGRLYSNLYAEDLTSNNLKNIVCLGDSQTFAGYIPQGHGWVERMMWKKRKSPCIIHNAGVSSDTIALAKARIGADVTAKKIDGVENIVVINLGTNDFYKGDNYETVWSSLQDLINTLKLLGWKIAVHTLGNLQQPYVADPTTVNGYITQLNNSIMTSNNVDYKIDINTELKDNATGVTAKKYYRKIDGVHFTPAAQRIIATTVLKSLGLD